jgi:hypothetical protein
MKDIFGGDVNEYILFINNAGFENSSFEDIAE